MDNTELEVTKDLLANYNRLTALYDRTRAALERALNTIILQTEALISADKMAAHTAKTAAALERAIKLFLDNTEDICPPNYPECREKLPEYQCAQCIRDYLMEGK